MSPIHLLRCSLLALAALPALAQPAPPPSAPEGLPRPADHRPAPPEMPGLHGIELSEAQQDQLFQIRHEQAPAVHAAQRQLRKAEAALQALSHAPDFTAARARSLADAVGQAHAELALLQAAGMARLQALLTPEQRRQRPEAERRPPHP